MSGIKFGSVCSGIEAASIAWKPLGWRAAWFAEIEPFPAAVLAQHWPQVPNLGDMTQIAARIDANEVEAPPVLVGGTPCQAFSVAGLRAGLSDDRGQLTIKYVGLIDAIDRKRAERGERPCVAVWENVPGVLCSKDNAFGAFIGLLAGEDCELQPPGDKWSNVGYVRGPERSIAWRVLDAQYFGVAQRRRRVFVVASARADIDPAKILFESEGVRRDIAPRREPQTTVAALTARGVGTCGADDNQAQAGHLIAFGGGNCSGAIDVAACLTAKGQRIDFDVETFAVHGTQDPDTNHELAHTAGRNQGQENAAFSVALRGRTGGMSAELGDQVSCALRASGSGKAYLLNNLRVRRLTPRECERLQGFPDDHTLIPYGRFIRPEKMDRDYAKYLMRGGQFSFDYCCRAAADGPRYKAIGNSMAVPVMRWIGERIDRELAALVDKTEKEQKN
ncbi:DNA cytosine methyltransferase [Salmonella enterica subsp. enterica serovar Agbeni]|nr:DNA cytosine methyltransferase [Salmonella enterica subsp. enterica serovar Agbeni]EIU1267255.1 DNA cytosine methyltransferase [Salmonella enterica subsp. enterica serovar Agbeni]